MNKEIFKFHACICKVKIFPCKYKSVPINWSRQLLPTQIAKFGGMSSTENEQMNYLITVIAFKKIIKKDDQLPEKQDFTLGKFNCEL